MELQNVVQESNFQYGVLFVNLLSTISKLVSEY